jgi:YVTN family beta-propeller protein
LQIRNTTPAVALPQQRGVVMAAVNTTIRTTLAALATVTIALPACGGSDDAPAAAATTALATATPPSRPPTTSALSTTPPPRTHATPPTQPTPSTDSTTPDDEWRQQVQAACDGDASLLAAIVENDGTAPGITAEARATKAVFEQDADPAIALPSELRETLDKLAVDAVEHLDNSIELAETGDLVAAQRALDEGFDRLARSATAIAMAGARCGPADPARVQNADLTIPLEMNPEQINTGFGSIWVSEGLAGRVVRLDPDTGAVQAVVDVGEAPLKLQPADGAMWVRTAAAYVAIDPTTNTVTATLAKADVGPDANRSWALDGAMWICDGRRLHRYDPTTLAVVATLDLDVDCNAVYATDELVVAWSYNEDPGESGTSAAAFVDPAANTVLATVELPVDVGGPAVLPDSAFFHGYQGSTAVVVDRATWGVIATPDLGVAGGGTGQAAFDGESIYVVNEDHQDVLVVDSATFAVTDTIEPLGVNAVAVDDGALWVARGQPFNVVQRFDLEQP